jgi:hypothetical protein
VNISLLSSLTRFLARLECPAGKEASQRRQGLKGHFELGRNGMFLVCTIAPVFWEDRKLFARLLVELCSTELYTISPIAGTASGWIRRLQDFHREAVRFPTPIHKDQRTNLDNRPATRTAKVLNLFNR